MIVDFEKPSLPLYVDWTEVPLERCYICGELPPPRRGIIYYNGDGTGGKLYCPDCYMHIEMKK